jgi:hypothetical protein
VISSLDDAAQPEKTPPQAQPLRLSSGDEGEREQARAGGEEDNGMVRRGDAAADGREEPWDGVGGGDLERCGAVVELVVEDLGVGAGDLEVAEGVWV